jgi:hypothetical protein
MKHNLEIWCLFGTTAKIKIYLQLVDYGKPLLFFHETLGWGVSGSNDEIEMGLAAHLQDNSETPT